MSCEFFPDKCKLLNTCVTPKMSYEGPRHPEVLVIGDVPREEDDETGVVMGVGESGELLRDTLRNAGFDLEKVGFTFVVKCRPTQRKQDRYQRYYTCNREPSSTEVNCCRCYVKAEIEVYKPKFIILLGAVALKAVLGETGITTKRGRIFDVDNSRYMPTYHPDMAYKDETYKDPFIKDIQFAHQVFTNGIPESKPVNYILCDNKSKLVKLVNYAGEHTEAAFDCETSELSAFNRSSQIVCVSFSFIETESWIVPLYNKYQLLFDKDLELAKTIIKMILESPDIAKIGQNPKFDIQYLEVTEGISVNNLIADTMLMHHLLSEQNGTSNLNYLTWKYLPEMGGYWEELDKYKAQHKEADPERGGSYRNIPWDVIVPYVGADTDTCLRIYHIIKPLLNNLG